MIKMIILQIFLNIHDYQIEFSKDSIRPNMTCISKRGYILISELRNVNFCHMSCCIVKVTFQFMKEKNELSVNR